MKLRIRHLYQRNLTYFFRIRIPTDLTRYFERAEIHKTLKTTELNIAKDLCTLFLKEFDNLFESVRMEISTSKLDISEIRALVSKRLKELLDKYEKFIATYGEISPETLKKTINDLESGINALREALAHNRLDFIYSRDEARALLKFHDYTEEDLSRMNRTKSTN